MWEFLSLPLPALHGGSGGLSWPTDLYIACRRGPSLSSVSNVWRQPIHLVYTIVE